MKGENPDGYYKPLFIATTLGMRSGKPHFQVGQDLPHLHMGMQCWLSCPPLQQLPSFVPVSCTEVSSTHGKHLSQTIKPKHELLPCCWRSREVKTSHEYAGNRKQTHKNPQQERTSQP